MGTEAPMGVAKRRASRNSSSSQAGEKRIQDQLSIDGFPLRAVILVEIGRCTSGMEKVAERLFMAGSRRREDRSIADGRAKSGSSAVSDKMCRAASYKK